MGKEISNIPEVQVDESEDDENIKMSVLQEFFPDLGLPEDTFETNKELIADVENYLTSVSGESTKIEDSWQLSDLTAPPTAVRADGEKVIIVIAPPTKTLSA